MNDQNPNDIKGVVDKTDLPSPIEGILPGMKFLERKYVLTLNQAGNVKIVSDHGSFVIGQYYTARTPAIYQRTKRTQRKFWKLDNGMLVRFKLDPSPDGYGCSEPGLYTPGGPVQITGRYPVYFTNVGDRVWITADGNFVEYEPLPGIENSFHVQMIRKHDKMTTMSKKKLSTREEPFSRIFKCEHCGTEGIRRSERKKFCSEYCRVRSHLDKKHGL